MRQASRTNRKKYMLFSLLFLAWVVDTISLNAMNVAIIPISKELGLDKSQTGFVLSSWFISGMLMTFLAGWLSDKFGSKKVLVTVFTIISLCTVFTGLAGSYLALIVIRLVLGIGEGGFSTSSSVALADIFQKEERARAKSILLAAQLVGGVLASVIAAWLLTVIGWRWMFAIFGVSGFMIAISIYKFFKLSHHGAEENEEEKKRSWSEILRNAYLWKLVIMYFGISVVNWGISAWMPTYLAEVRHLDLLSLGSLSMIPAILGLLASLGCGWLLDRYIVGREKLLIMIGSVIGGISLYLMFHASTVLMVILYQSFTSIGIAAVAITVLSLPLKYTSKNQMGSLMGIMYFGGSLAGAIAPTTMGYLIKTFHNSYDAAFWFLIAALLLCFLTSILFHSPKQNSIAQHE